MYEVVKGSARYASKDRQLIDVVIVVDGEQRPFTASPTDSLEAGQEIYTNAVFGEYGEVKPYVAPDPVDVPAPTAEELLAQIAALTEQVKKLQTEK